MCSSFRSFFSKNGVRKCYAAFTHDWDDTRTFDDPHAVYIRIGQGIYSVFYTACRVSHQMVDISLSVMQIGNYYLSHGGYVLPGDRLFIALC